MKRGVRTGVWALLAAVTLTGCGGGNQPVERPTVSMPKAESDEAVLNLAEQVFLRDCMKRAGFDYWITDPAPVPGSRDFPYVIDDVSWAQQHGYGSDIKRAEDKLRADDPNRHYYNSLSPERRKQELAVTNGTTPTGLSITTPDGMRMSTNPDSCRSQAQRKLYGDLAGWLRARASVDALKEMRRERVTADPEFTAALKPWSDCMRAAGHPHANPEELRARLPSPEHPLPKTDEVALAVAEAKCAHSSQLAAISTRLDAKYRDALHSQYRSVVDSYHRLRSAALPKAHSVLEAEHMGS